MILRLGYSYCGPKNVGIQLLHAHTKLQKCHYEHCSPIEQCKEVQVFQILMEKITT